MTDPRPLLVPIDDFGLDAEALAFLVETAAQLGRPLQVLLLESPRLYAVADLPFTREITLFGAGERDLERNLLRRHGGRARSDARERLAELAALRRVALAFELREGERLGCVLRHDPGVDSWLPRRPTAAAAREVRPPALGIVLAGVPGDSAAVAAANMLAARSGRRDLYVHSNQPWPPQALAGLATPGLKLHRLPTTALDPPALLRLLRRLRNELLIMPRELLLTLDPLALEQAMDRAAGQLLIVDGGEAAARAP